jgi:peroxiredoxin
MMTDSPSSGRAPFLILGLGLLIGLVSGAVVLFGLPVLPALGGPKASNLTGPTATPAPAAVAGAPAPDFTLKDLSGNDVTLSSLQGQVVLVNFWATWCAPCRYEMPALQQRYEALKDQGLTILAVDADEPIEDVAPFVEAYKLTFTVLLDPGATVNDLYRIRGYPTTFFVDREGMIAKLHLGPLTEEQLDGYLKDLGISE